MAIQVILKTGRCRCRLFLVFSAARIRTVRTCRLCDA